MLVVASHGGIVDCLKWMLGVRRRRHRLPLVPACVIAALGCIVPACERGNDEIPLQPESGGTVRIAIREPFDFLTPVRQVRWPTNLFLEHITPPLGRVTEIGDIQWRMAQRLIELGPGMRFPLRRALWEDGTPVTASDFVLTFELMLHPGAPGHERTRFGLVKDVVAQNDSLLFFHLLDVTSRRRVDALLMPLPRHVLGDDPNPRQLIEWPITSQPLSCGPFRVDSASTRALDLLPNDSAAFPVPLLERVEVRQMEIADAVRGFRAGDFDVVDDVPAAYVKEMSATPGARVTAFVGASYTFLGWNLRDARFGDHSVRVAAAHAIDIERLIRDHTLGQGDPAHGPLVPVLGFRDSLQAFEHDPGLARRMLDSAGWRDADGDGVRERRGAKLAFHILVSDQESEHELLARDIAADLRKVGIRALVRSVELIEMAARLESSNFEAFIGLWFPSLGLNLEGVWHSEARRQFNYGQFADARADSILVQLRYAEPGSHQDELLDAFQRRVYALQPYLFLYQGPRFAAFSRRVHGARPTVVSTFWNLPEWWIPRAMQRDPEAP